MDEKNENMDELTKEALSQPAPAEEKIHFPWAALIVCGVIVALMVACVIVILVNR